MTRAFVLVSFLEYAIQFSDGGFNGDIMSGPYIIYRYRSRNIGLNSDPNEFPAVGVGRAHGADNALASARQSKKERLSSRPGCRRADHWSTLHRTERCAEILSG